MGFNGFRHFMDAGSARTIKAKKNIVYMFFIKGGSILINLLLVPLTLDYVNSATYGVWLTLSSMIAWMSFFDIGINNGLKNKLAEAIALDDYVLGKKYVSTTYAILSIIFIPLMFIGLLVNPVIDWSSLLNLPEGEVEGLRTAIAIIISFFCVQFILSTINIVLQADQRPADAALRTLLQHIVSVIIIVILIYTTEGNLVNLCLALCAAPLIVLLLFNFTLFSKRYRSIRPSLHDVDFSTTPALMKLGAQFFIIQIAGIIQFQMMNFIIMRYYGATEVTSYNIAHKYFNVIFMVWGIILTPLWAATTDAIAKHDYEWIRRSQRKYMRVWGMMSVLALMMLMVSSSIYNLWIGDKVVISFWLSFWTMLYFLVLMFGSTFVYILNGAGLLKVQTIASTISPIVFLLVSYLLIHFGYPPYSVLIAAIAANFNGLILAPVQYYLDIHKRWQL